MKKIIALLLVLVMALSLVACGAKDEKVTLNVIAAQYGGKTAAEKCKCKSSEGFNQLKHGLLPP